MTVSSLCVHGGGNVVSLLHTIIKMIFVIIQIIGPFDDRGIFALYLIGNIMCKLLKRTMLLFLYSDIKGSVSCIKHDKCF